MWKKDDILFEEYSKLRVYCNYCGHSITNLTRKEKVICNYCGHYVFRSPKDEFKFKLGKILKNGG